VLTNGMACFMVVNIDMVVNWAVLRGISVAGNNCSLV